MRQRELRSLWRELVRRLDPHNSLRRELWCLRREDRCYLKRGQMLLEISHLERAMSGRIIHAGHITPMALRPTLVINMHSGTLGTTTITPWQWHKTIKRMIRATGTRMPTEITLTHE